MKIIDLLNKIANGKEIPKRIIYGNEEYSFNYKDMTYYCCDHDMTDLLNSDLIGNILNDEVEIIEEEPRDIEVCGSFFTKSEYNKLARTEEDKKIEKISLSTIEGKPMTLYTGAEVEIIEKINEIIDYINNKD